MGVFGRLWAGENLKTGRIFPAPLPVLLEGERSPFLPPTEVPLLLPPPYYFSPHPPFFLPALIYFLGLFLLFPLLFEQFARPLPS